MKQKTIENIPELIESETLFISALLSHFDLMKKYGFDNDFIETTLLKSISKTTNHEVNLYR